MDEFDKALTKKVLKYNQHKWHELSYDEIRNKPYLIGKKKESDENRFIYVLDPNKRFRFNFLKKIVTDTGSSSVLLNIHGSDSSSVYYKLHAGLVDLNDESNEKDSRRSKDEMSDEDSSEEECMSDQDSCLESPKQESSEELSDSDAGKEVSDESPSPQTITISD